MRSPTPYCTEISGTEGGRASPPAARASAAEISATRGSGRRRGALSFAPRGQAGPGEVRLVALIARVEPGFEVGPAVPGTAVPLDDPQVAVRTVVPDGGSPRLQHGRGLLIGEEVFRVLLPRRHGRSPHAAAVRASDCLRFGGPGRAREERTDLFLVVEAQAPALVDQRHPVTQPQTFVALPGLEQHLSLGGDVGFGQGGSAARDHSVLLWVVPGRVRPVWMGAVDRLPDMSRSSCGVADGWGPVGTAVSLRSRTAGPRHVSGRTPSRPRPRTTYGGAPGLRPGRRFLSAVRLTRPSPRRPPQRCARP
ncbi:hypothetical protein SLAVM298S_01452 [Streptomyces lavendulae subsp. lavendulae]